MQIDHSISAQLLSSIDGSVIVCNAELKCLYISPNGIKLLHSLYDLDIQIGHQLNEAIALLLKSKQQFQKIYQEVFEKNKPIRTNIDVSNYSQGKILSLQVKFSPFQYENTTTMLCHIIEIPYKKQDYLFFKKKTEEYYSLLDKLPQLIFSFQERGDTHYFNEKVLQFTGLTRKELQNGMYEYLIHPENRVEVIQHIYDSIRIQKEVNLEVLLRRKDGEYRWLKGSLTLLSEGKTRTWFGFFQDIHQQKSLEEQLWDQAEEFQIMTRFMPQMVWVLELNGLPSFFNKRWYDYTGLSSQESLSRNWIKVIHKNDRPKVNDLLMMSRNEPYSSEEFRILSKEGEYRWFLYRAIPVQTAEGDILKWLGTFTDINDQKISEQRKDEFINIASHELKTPLTSLKAYLQITNNYVDNKNPLWVYINGANKASNRLQKLIENLLDISRLKDPNIEEKNSSNFELQPFIKEVIEQFQNTYPKQKINLTFNVQNSKVFGNAHRIEQVLDNLLNNAIKYSPSFKPIDILVTKADRHFVAISIQDQGIGIPRNLLKDIFKRYYRIKEDQTSTGLGLGLYICKKIVTAHGGWIFAESKKGKGSKFTFTLPIAIS